MRQLIEKKNSAQEEENSIPIKALFLRSTWVS